MPIARMTRLLVYLPELLIFVQGLQIGCRAVLSSLLLILLLIYCFGILIFFLKPDEQDLPDELYGTLLWVMWTLMMDGTLMSETRDATSHLLAANVSASMAAHSSRLRFLERPGASMAARRAPEELCAALQRLPGPICAKEHGAQRRNRGLTSLR